MVHPEADLRTMGDQEARAIIPTLSSDSPYWASWYALIHEDLNRAISLLVDGDEASWPVTAWQELLKVLPHPFRGKDIWRRICAALVQAKDLTELAGEISFLVREASKVAEEADEACLFDVWDRIVQPILGRETEVSDDVLFQALNAPAGALAECIVNRLALRNPNRSGDVPTSIWTRLETLAKSRGGSPTVAHTILASQMSRFFALDRDWVRENLIPLIDWKLNPNAAAVWKGFLWQFSVPADLWPLIKTNFILSLKNSSELGDAIETAASWFTAICIEQPTWIETEPAAEVLKSLPPNGRAAAARVLWQKMEGAGAGSDTLWRERIGPWLRNTWPRNLALRHPDASRDIAVAALRTDTEFPSAVSLILEIIGHADLSLVAWQLDQSKSKHSQNHPRELLRLLSALLDPAVQLHDRKLRTVLEEISAACTACTDGPEYRKIDECLLKQGL
jgi:hypothetical protein